MCFTAPKWNLKSDFLLNQKNNIKIDCHKRTIFSSLNAETGFLHLKGPKTLLCRTLK
jgi:hypothetical protein